MYLPILWDQPSFCSKSPIALGYTRGHFSALVPSEPNPVAAAAAVNSFSKEEKNASLPLLTADKLLLPVHFLSVSESEDTEAILRRWMDVAVTESGVLVARQAIDKPPLLVAQMTEEWLNHYRKLG